MHAAPTAIFFGYDPIDLPKTHLVWLVEKVVEEAIRAAGWKRQKGQPAFNPKLCTKILFIRPGRGADARSRVIAPRSVASIALLQRLAARKPPPSVAWSLAQWILTIRLTSLSLVSPTRIISNATMIAE